MTTKNIPVLDQAPGVAGGLRLVRESALERNPAWVQLLGLCPLLAVSNSLVNALGLALASSFVLIGSALAISALRQAIPQSLRLPCFVLVIATLTTLSTMLLEAYAFSLYERIALFVQIIVSNCMILGRIEAFASRRNTVSAGLDALGAAFGFGLALILLGSVREVLGQGTLCADMTRLFGPGAAACQIDFSGGRPPLRLALLPPGAFIIAGLLLGLGRALPRRSKPDEQTA